MAEGAAPETRTTIDSLVELLKKQGKMDLNTISTALGVDTTIVENWAKVLENGNIIKITYEVGKMYLTPSGLTPEREASERGRLEARASALEAQTSSQALSLDKLSETLALLKTSAAAAEHMESTQIPEVRRAIAELNGIYASVEQKNRGLEQMAKRAAELYDDVSKKAAELSAKIGYLEPGSAEKVIQDARQASSQITKNMTGMGADASQAVRSANNAIEQIRKSVAEQTRAINQQLDQSRRELAEKIKQYAAESAAAERQLREQSKSMESALGGIGGFAKEKERQAKRLRDIKVEFNNNYTKISEEMLAQRATVAALSKELLAKVDTLKRGFGEAAELDDTLSTVRRQVEELEKDIADARQAVSDTQAQLRALNAMASATTEQKMVMLDSVERKAKVNTAKVSGIKDKAERATSATRKLTKKDDE